MITVNLFFFVSSSGDYSKVSRGRWSRARVLLFRRTLDAKSALRGVIRTLEFLERSEDFEISTLNSGLSET